MGSSRGFLITQQSMMRRTTLMVVYRGGLLRAPLHMPPSLSIPPRVPLLLSARHFSSSDKPKRKFFETNDHPLVPLGPTPTKLVSFTVHGKPLLPSLATYVKGNSETLQELFNSLMTGQARVAVFFKPDSKATAEDSSNTGCYAQVQRLDFKMKDGMEYRLLMNHADSSMEFWKVDVRIPGTDRSDVQVWLKEKVVSSFMDMKEIIEWQALVGGEGFLSRVSSFKKENEIVVSECLPLPHNWLTMIPHRPATPGFEKYMQEYNTQHRVMLNMFSRAFGQQGALALPQVTQEPEWCLYITNWLQSASAEEHMTMLRLKDPLEMVKLTTALLEREIMMKSMKQTVEEEAGKDMNKATEAHIAQMLIKLLQEKHLPKDAGESKTSVYRKRLKEFEEGEKRVAAAASSTEATETTEIIDGQEVKTPKPPLIQKSREEEDETYWKAQEENGGKPLQLPPKIKKVIEEDLAKLESMQRENSEYNHLRNYVDWLTAVPWGRTTAETYDVAATEAVMNQDHFGMEDVKSFISEFVAVSKLKGSTSNNGKIICLVGPPGVGKTSIGQSIAKALNKKFFRFSVGGLSDASEIKGHRRTYVGSMPGKLVQMFKTTGCVNPLMMIDEIDKLGRRSHSGDPSAALLELLDPSQNTSFVDQYLDVPLDASQVLFICTANSISTIPEPLLDRLEIIQLSGYDAKEKIEIAKKYLAPKLAHSTGLSDFNGLTDDAIATLTRLYSRESGVRNLEKLMAKIYRKVALEHVKENKAVNTVKSEDLEKYVGKPRYLKERFFEDVTPPGVVMGLAAGQDGGTALYIETTAIKGAVSPEAKKDDQLTVSRRAGSIASTGNLGETMKESLTLAYLNAKRESKSNFFDTNEVHVHVPHGATPKDGPSAGITISVALLSLAWSRPIDPTLAMTGEISLTGLVLPVGGIREKTLAARRSGIKTLILPEENLKDFDELAPHLKEGMNVKFVKRFSDVVELVFPNQ